MAILKLKDKNGNVTEIPAIVGPPGKDGKSAYQYAQDGGYNGTEEEFAVKLAEENPTQEEFNQLSKTKIDTPTVAKVGQTIVVKSVDENGKPTEWECVNMVSGGENVFVVNVSTNIAGDTTSGYVADKTFRELVEAYENGMEIRCISGRGQIYNHIYADTDENGDGFSFSYMYGNQGDYISIYPDDSVWYETYEYMINE